MVWPPESTLTTRETENYFTQLPESSRGWVSTVSSHKLGHSSQYRGIHEGACAVECTKGGAGLAPCFLDVLGCFVFEVVSRRGLSWSRML